MKNLMIAASGCALAFALAAPAVAQQADAAQPSEDGIGVIVVTAQKRSENVQNIPVAVTAISARDAGWPLTLQLLFYPGTAGHQNTPSHKTFAKGFLLEEAHITYFFNHYLRSPQDRDDWRFAPLDGVDEHGHARDPEGVAPAWFGLAECDPLTDEGVMYADRLRHADVAVDLEIYAGVVHGFINFGRAIPEARTAHQHAALALRNAFGAP